MVKLPLEGIRIIEDTVAWGGPFAAMNLADWGAEVIRIETIQQSQPLTRGLSHPRTPAPSDIGNGGIAAYYNRENPYRPWNRLSFFNCHARNKLSCTMDLKRPEGKDIFKRLIAVSDVFLENNAAYFIEDLGLTYDVLKNVNPKLIMLSMTGFGNYGPFKYYRTLGYHQEGFIGHTALRGYPDSDPSTTTRVFHADESCGINAALAILMALHYRNRTGKGQFIDVSIGETTMPHFGEAIMDYTMNKHVQGTMGNRMPGAAPCGCYRCRGGDRWINITVTCNKEWEGLCRAMGNPDWTQEDRFSDTLQRESCQDELDRFIEEWTIQNNHYDLMFLLQKEGVPAGPVIFEDDAYTDPHLRERGFFEKLNQVDCGTHEYPGLGFRLSRTPNKIRRPPVRLGEDNEYVYKQILGLSNDEYRHLEETKHIGMDFVPEAP